MIETTFEDGIALLTIDHGPVNALDIELLTAIPDALDAAEEASAKAIVITGMGSTFSAGADLLRLLEEGGSYVEAARPHASRTFERMFTCETPTIAAINGHAIAGGCVVALACDHRITIEGDHRIGLPELRVGVPFPIWALETVRYAVAQPHLQRLMYSGRLAVPEEAHALGLVDEIVAPDRLLPRAMEMASRLASIPRPTFALTKRTLRRPFADRARASEAVDDEGTAIWTSPEARASVRRFLDRTLGGR